MFYNLHEKDWPFVKLEDVAQVLGGYAFKSKEFSLEGNPIIKIKNVNGRIVDKNECDLYPVELCKNLSKFIISNDDILVAMTGAGSVGRVSKFIQYDNRTYYLNQRVGKIIVKESLLDNEYLFQLLSTKRYEKILFDLANGSGQPNLSPKTIGLLEIPLPPLNEQKAIADILSSLDDKIELNNQMNETLEEMAQTLFKRWFVDFEFSNEEGQPYKSSGGEMIESELGLIPKGWKNGQLEDICSYSSNKIMIEKLDKNNYISTENMLPNKGGIIEASGLPTTSKVTSFNIGDTLISNIRPYFKKIYYCNQNGGCSNDVLCFNPKLKDYTYCLYLYLYEDNFFDYMMSGSKGTKMPRGDKKQIMSYPIVIANSDIYLKFNKIVSPMFEKLLTLKEENKNLIKLRDTLLPKLMSGEIRVSDLC